MTERSDAQGSTKKPVQFLSFFKKLYRDPYGTLDHLDLRIGRLQFNLMKDDQKLIKAMIGPFLIAPVLLWWITAFIMSLTSPYNGFDAGINQLSYPLTALLMGEGWDKMVFHFYDQYGKGAHWTASLIYFGFFVYISKYYRKHDVKNSLNIAVTTCLTAFTIAIFEYFWMFSYFIFQQQHWILGFTAPQTMINVQNFVFFMLGILRIVNIEWKDVKPNFNKWTWLFLAGTIQFMLMWWFYPLLYPVQQISVNTDLGIWTSSQWFPQTVYTVARSPQSSTFLNTEAYWVWNDGIHLVNTITKIFMTLTCLNIFLLKEKNNE